VIASKEFRSKSAISPILRVAGRLFVKPPSVKMKRGLVVVLSLVTVHARECNQTTAFNGTAFDLTDCTMLDLSCPTDGIVSRSKTVCANLLRPPQIKMLARALEAAPMLEEISLRGAPLGGTGTLALAPALSTCASLHTLNLGSCRVGDAGARALAKHLLQPRTPETLRRLDLAHNDIGDDGVRAVVAELTGPDSSSLDSLDLAWNAIGSRGGRYIGDALKGATRLADLTLGWNGLMDRGARAIGDALAANGALATLDVRAIIPRLRRCALLF